MASSRWILIVCLLCGLASAEPTLIDRIDIRGTHRIEPDTIRTQLATKRGQALDPAQLRVDLRAVWQLGAFTAVSASLDGSTLVIEVVERPAIRKVLVAGNHELGLDKINDVLDLEHDALLDIAKVHANRDKVLELYREHGYYLATVDADTVPAGAGAVDVRLTVEEHAKIRVGEVTFTGNHALSTDELRGVLATKPPGVLSFLNDSGTYRQDMLERDLAVLIAHYLDAGFATVKLGEPALRLSRDKRRMYVTIPIEEGPRFAYGTITIKGDLLGTPASELARLAAKPGATFSRSTVERDRKLLETEYADQGYANANVQPRMHLDAEHRRIDLGFEIVRGKRVYIERIHIRGNTKTRDKVVRREMKIAEGELYSASKLELSRARVMALGFFETVTVSTTRGSSDEFVDVNVEVKERQTGMIQLGAGFSSRESFIVQGQASWDNFGGRGQTLAFQAQLSAIRRLFSFRFVEPYFLDTPWTFSAELYNQSHGLGSVSREATGGALTWGYPLSDHARAFVTYRLEEVGIQRGSGGVANLGARTTDIPLVDTANLLRGGLTSSLRGSLVYDTRNNRLFPTEGWYGTAYAEYAGKLTGSENQFVRWGGFLRRYHHLGGPFVLRLNGEVGVTTSLDGRGVPLTERYLLGGITDIRGYLPRSIGPQLFVPRPGDVGQPLAPFALGGNLQVIGNAEVEFPIARKLGISGVVFFDVGNAFNLEPKLATPSDGFGLRKSVGAGIRWFSPIGPLRFEWGIPLDLKPGERASGLDFTIGTSF